MKAKRKKKTPVDEAVEILKALPLRQRRRAVLRAGQWKLGGGGCLLAGADKYPCDDTYTHSLTGKEIIVFSTREAHRNMPAKVDDIRDIYELPGVSDLEE